MMSELADDVLAVLADASLALAGTAAGDEMAAIQRRMGEPMRLAIAGRVKAGKSTLLNAMIGDRIAATDASECTRVVTWYRFGEAPGVVAVRIDGSVEPLDFAHHDGALSFALPSADLAMVDRVEVRWPAVALQDLVLIDTPGIDSATKASSSRTLAALLPNDDQPGIADAVIYLVRHLDASDVEFLEAFTAGALSSPSPLHCIAVLGRADEVGAGELAAMDTAASVAHRLASDPRMRRFCSAVMPVAGLAAAGASRLDRELFRDLVTLAQSEPRALRRLLLDARILGDDTAGAGTTLAPARRLLLLDSFGIWGIRTAVDEIRNGRATSAASLRSTLEQRSGLAALRDVLTARLLPRRDLLKARSAVTALIDGLTRHGNSITSGLAEAAELLLSGRHELVEAAALAGLRSADLGLSPNVIVEAERVLGYHGLGIEARLALDATSTAAEAALIARDVTRRWRIIAEDPFVTPDGSHLARIVARSGEGLASRALSGS